MSGGLLTKKESSLAKEKYDYIRDFYYEGLAAVRINYKWGFIDKSSELVIPATFD